MRLALERELAATEGLAPFFARPLLAPDPEWRRVSLPMLIGFLKQPIRFRLKLRDNTWAESDDPYYRLALRDRIDAALDAEFEQLAVRVFGPMLQRLKEGIHADYT